MQGGQAEAQKRRERRERRVRGRCEPRMIPAEEAEVRGVEHTLFHPQSSIVAVCPDSPLPVRGSKGQSTKGIPNMSQRAVGRRPTICWLPLSEWVYIYPPMRKRTLGGKDAASHHWSYLPSASPPTNHCSPRFNGHSCTFGHSKACEEEDQDLTKAGAQREQGDICVLLGVLVRYV